MQRSSVKSFYFESAKNHKYPFVAEESTTALRRQQTQPNLLKQTYRHMDFFYSSDILLKKNKKNVLTVGISERQQCMSRAVGRNDWLLK